MELGTGNVLQRQGREDCKGSDEFRDDPCFAWWDSDCLNHHQQICKKPQTQENGRSIGSRQSIECDDRGWPNPIV